MDAASGEILSPIQLDSAVKIARSFVDEKEEIALTEGLPSFKARRTGEARPVFRILFKDAVKTEIFVDQDTGETLLVLDQGRRLAIGVNRLHELDFAGLSRLLLSVLGTAIVVLSCTGFFLSLPKKV